MIQNISNCYLHHLFENRVRLNPNNVAVIYKNQSITYQELNNKADQLAGHILQQWEDITNNKDNPSKLIAILLEPNIEIIISILAVLKAGFTYIPLDPDNPESRLKYMIKNSQPSLLLTRETIGKKFDFVNFFKETNTGTIFLDKTDKKSNAKIASDIAKNDLAYVIYTSGSTGNPKGVMISHDSVVNTILDVNEKFCVTQKDKILMLSSPSFDLSVYDIFGSLAAGATIIMPNINLRRDPIHWAELILNNGVTIWNSVPSLAQILVDYIEGNSIYTILTLRLILLSGDWIPLNLPVQIRKICQNVTIISLGGATEASIWSVYYPVEEILSSWKSIPYGKALSNQTVYVLREDLQTATLGEVGMICIGGIGLAKGYWNDKEKTDKSFITHPDTKERLYKTGDFGQYLEDGNIEFLGREDEQVKIGGYRIELGEIEHAINLYPQVKECIVLKNQNQLIAYYVQSRIAKEPENIIKGSFDSYITSWKELYDDIYTTSNTSNLKNFNTSGWISSYTNKPFPKNEMQEWVEMTAERILSLNAQNILEIGCGTGLLLFRIANFCKKYIGVDFSSVVIDKLKKNLNESNLYKNVEIFHEEATDFIDKLISQRKDEFDLIMMNSVVQYFPNLQYLENIINKSIDVIKEGKIFIGDVRDYRLMVPFAISKILNKKGNVSNIESVIYKECLFEKELLISPEYFVDLKNKNSAISKIELLPKMGKYHNEMNCYRYDVVLHINHNEVIKNNKNKINWVTWSERCLSLQELLSQDKEIIAIQNYPNKRIWAIYNISNSFVADKIFDSKKYEKFTQEENNLYDLEPLYELAHKYDYCLNVSLSTGSKNSAVMYDLFFKKRSNAEYVIDSYNYGDKKLNELVSNRQFSPLSPEALKDYIKEYLPSYMVPTHYILLEKLPLTPNGKIDKKLLLTLVDFELHNKEYIQPNTPIEKDLVSMWGKALNVDSSKISINDNFFSMGGHSISAILIIAHIRSIHNIRLKVSDIYNYPTIEQLAKFIESECVIKGNALPEIVDYKNDKNVMQTFPLSYIQLFFWFLKSGKCRTCNIATRVRFVGALDINYLNKAVNELLRKHKIFWYAISSKRPAQTFIEPFVFSIPIMDITNLTISEREKFLRENYTKLLDNDFKLSTVPLLRIELVYLSDNEHELQISLPHIISDAITADNIIKELKTCYQSYYQVLEDINSSSLVQYVDYARHERNLIRGSIKDYISFWREYTKTGTFFYLPGEFFEQKELIKPFDLPYINLTEENIKKLNILCQKNNATIAMGFLAVLCMSLYKFTKQDNIFITVIRSNRSEEILSKAIGPFVNSDLIKVEVKENNFLKILKSVKHSFSEAEQYWDCPEIIKFGCAAENNLKFSRFSLKLINLISQLLTKLFFRADLEDGILSMYSRLMSPIPHSLKNKILRLWNLLRLKKNTKCLPQGVEIMFNLLPNFFEKDITEDNWLNDLKILFPVIEEEKAFPSNYDREERFTNDNFLIFTISKVEGNKRLSIEGPCNNCGSNKILQMFHDTICQELDK